jgi:pyrimidine operon attenuation protein/uracil phosphoribosyltransferase
MVNLTTTNVLLGIMAAVSLLEALAVIGLMTAGYFVYRQITSALARIEEQQIAPAAEQVNRILDDIRGVTAVVKEETGRIDSLIHGAADAEKSFTDHRRRAA